MNEKVKAAIIALLVAIALYAGVAATIYEAKQVGHCTEQGLAPVRDVRPFHFKIRCMGDE